MTFMPDLRRLVCLRGRPRPGSRSLLRRAAFTLVLAFVFLRVSFLYQILTHEFGSGFFILYLIIVPLAITFVLAGGFRRVLRARTALYWTSFLFWMGVTVPFSPFVLRIRPGRDLLFARLVPDSLFLGGIGRAVVGLQETLSHHRSRRGG